jgi:hypothetical protein
LYYFCTNKFSMIQNSWNNYIRDARSTDFLVNSPIVKAEIRDLPISSNSPIFTDFWWKLPNFTDFDKNPKNVYYTMDLFKKNPESLDWNPEFELFRSLFWVFFTWKLYKISYCGVIFHQFFLAKIVVCTIYWPYEFPIMSFLAIGLLIFWGRFKNSKFLS